MIVSLAIPDIMKSEIDNAAVQKGFRSRSEFIRQALRSYMSETSVSELSGRIVATLNIVYDREKSREDLRKLQHKFEDVVSVQLHSDLKEDQCLDVFVLRGEANRIAGLLNSVRLIRGVRYSKLTAT